jgi:hypothetical protein
MGLHFVGGTKIEVSRVDKSRIIFQFKSLSIVIIVISPLVLAPIFFEPAIFPPSTSVLAPGRSQGFVPKLSNLYWASSKMVSACLKPRQCENGSVTYI